ncbi:MAG: hypothetical protein R2773_03425 [Flavobacteriaceae bacterium]
MFLYNVTVLMGNNCNTGAHTFPYIKASNKAAQLNTENNHQ